LLPVTALTPLVLAAAVTALTPLVLAAAVAALTPLVLAAAVTALVLLPVLVLAALVLAALALLAALVLAVLVLAALALLAALVMLHELLCVVLQVLELAHDYFLPSLTADSAAVHGTHAFVGLDAIPSQNGMTPRTARFAN